MHHVIGGAGPTVDTPPGLSFDFHFSQSSYSSEKGSHKQMIEVEDRAWSSAVTAVQSAAWWGGVCSYVSCLHPQISIELHRYAPGYCSGFWG